MKTISMKEAHSIACNIMYEAEKRRDKYFEKEACVVVMEEDIQEELLRLCRGHAEYLCGGKKEVPFFLWENEEHKNFTVEWIEAGEQVYAMWRGWV